MCDSLTIIDHGKLVFTGSVEALDRKMNGDAPIDIRFAPGAGEEAWMPPWPCSSNTRA